MKMNSTLQLSQQCVVVCVHALKSNVHLFAGHYKNADNVYVFDLVSLLLYVSSSAILSAVEQVVGRWKHFGFFLGVETYKIDAIAQNNKEVSDCMLQLVSQWMSEESGTGRRPRTWQTVVMAVKNTGLVPLAEKLAKEYGISLS